MLQFIKMLNGASGYKNLSNSFIWCYSQVAVILKDDSGNTVKMTQAPCWIPPNWTINTGTAADELFGLQGSDGAGAEEFRGFLSKVPPTHGLFSESEVITSGATAMRSVTESEAFTHVP